MSEWVISIGAVVILTTVASYVIPEGKLGKYVKGIFSILILLVVIKPVINFDFNDISASINQSNVDLSYQSGYLEYVYKQKDEYVAKEIALELEDLKITEAEVDVKSAIDENGLYQLKKITINLENSVINSDKEHIDIIEEIQKVIYERFGVKKEMIVIER